jgi:hypothetical protein
MTSATKFTIVALSLFTASCAPYYDTEAARREQERLDSNTCASYGTVPNSPAFNDCMRDLATQNNSSTYNDSYYSGRRYDDHYERPNYKYHRNYYR